MNATEAYALSRSYTKKTADALGAVKGANCTIKETEHKDGRTKVVFQWTGDSGAKQETTIYIYDGTPIYVWESGDTYKFGDLVIYESSFYRCIVENSATTFNDDFYEEINSTDGNYDIVQNKELLPVRFTPADKKMFYAYEEECFYFWNGYNWSPRFKLKAGNNIKIEKDAETGETVISTTIKSITSEELAEMWED